MIAYLIFQTTTTERTVNISLTEFPFYFSLVSDPGYDLNKLESFGFKSELDFFMGCSENNDSVKTLSWTFKNISVEREYTADKK